MGTNLALHFKFKLCTSVAYGVNKVFANQQLYFSVIQYTVKHCITVV